MTTPEIRTFSLLHNEVGTIEFSIPLQSPREVDAYLCRILADLPVAERMQLHTEMMKRADDMWASHALWLGDPEASALMKAASPVELQTITNDCKIPDRKINFVLSRDMAGNSRSGRRTV
jgi:hypothetical protein